MEKKFDYTPEAYAPKDFMGNPLLVGDTVVIADSTYSKTPTMVYGVIKKIETELKKKDKALKSFTVYVFITGSSEDTTGFESGCWNEKDMKSYYGDDYDPDNEEYWDGYTFNSKSFINILKIK